MTFRVMAGLTAIWAGNARELKDGAIFMSGKKYDVTEDVLNATTKWLAEKAIERVTVLENGTRITLKVEIEEAKE